MFKLPMKQLFLDLELLENIHMAMMAQKWFTCYNNKFNTKVVHSIQGVAEKMQIVAYLCVDKKICNWFPRQEAGWVELDSCLVVE